MVKIEGLGQIVDAVDIETLISQGENIKRDLNT